MVVVRKDVRVGGQVVGRWGDDGRLLRTARWLMDYFLKQ